MPARRTSVSTPAGPTKGHACVRCKRHKLKCDGVKPSCNTCLRLRKRSECKYEALVNGTQAAKPVQHADSEHFEMEKALILPPEILFLDHSIDWWKAEEPPVPIKDFLLATFVNLAHHVHFDQLLPCFLIRLRRYPSTSPKYPHPALLNVIYLTAIFFLSSPRHPSRIHQRIKWNALEAELSFLKKTKTAMPTSLAMSEHVLDYMLASSLLSKYFHCGLRNAEGHVQSTAAMHFALACNLHTISSPGQGGDSSVSSLRPYSTDARDIHYSINAFWCAFIVDRAGSSIVNLDVAIPDACIATVLLPYEATTSQPDSLSNAEYQSVASLYNPDSRALDVSGEPTHIIKVKSAALLGKVVTLTNRAPLEGTTDLQRTSAAYRAEFCKIEQALVKFINSLPSVPHPPFTRSECAIADLAALRSLARASFVRLHHPFETCYAGSNERLLRIAKEIVEEAKILEKINEVNWSAGLQRPWTFASEFFHKEIHRVLRSKGPAEVLTKVEKEGVLGLRDNMHFLMQMLTRFSTVYIAFYSFAATLDKMIAQDTEAIERYSRKDGWDIVTPVGSKEPAISASEVACTKVGGQASMVPGAKPIKWVHYSQK